MDRGPLAGRFPCSTLGYSPLRTSLDTRRHGKESRPVYGESALERSEAGVLGGRMRTTPEHVVLTCVVVPSRKDVIVELARCQARRPVLVLFFFFPSPSYAYLGLDTYILGAMIMPSGESGQGPTTRGLFLAQCHRYGMELGEAARSERLPDR